MALLQRENFRIQIICDCLVLKIKNEPYYEMRRLDLVNTNLRYLVSGFDSVKIEIF